jgi:putative membrane protein
MWKGLLAGLAGGLAGSWTMNQFQAIWTRRQYGFDRPHGAQSLQQGNPKNPALSLPAGRNEDATERVAEIASRLLSRRHLSRREKRVGGAIVHYLFGVSAGAMYGIAAERVSSITVGGGLLFGALFWLLVDEGIIPLLRLSKSPKSYPVSTHACALASHLVYGITTELVRRALRVDSPCSVLSCGTGQARRS